MNHQPFVSIIIPVKKINHYIRESIPYLLELDYENYEILILTDEPAGETFEKTTIIPTGKIGPAGKRDLALTHAKGEILAFIDDDAYPTKDWLNKVTQNFEDEKVAAVGGPAITPPDDSAHQRASGLVFESLLGGGNTKYRYVPSGNKRLVDDYPTVNFSIRKDVFEQLGGFDTKYWPGEDTKLCLDIIYAAKKKIVYDPEAIVYHHRRNLFREHLEQTNNYALHRGFFAKKYPETSRKTGYFIPSLFLIYLPISILSIKQPLLILPLLAYIFALVATGAKILIQQKNLQLPLLTMSGIVLTHIFYGFYFLKGLFSKELEQ